MIKNVCAHKETLYKLMISPYNKINIIKVANIDMKIISIDLIKNGCV